MSATSPNGACASPDLPFGALRPPRPTVAPVALVETAEAAWSGGTPIGIRSTGRLRWLLIVFSAVLMAVWALRREQALASLTTGHRNPFALLLGGVCLMFGWQLWLAWRERPFTTLLAEERRLVDGLTVCVNLPAYNEDPTLLSHAIASIFAQTRLPQRVQVVDDGSSIDYSALRAYWMARVPAGVEFSWVRTENRGKRHAQMETFSGSTEDILVTMDSDTVLNRRAIEEGLKPFVNPAVSSVAGLVLGLNKHTNMITRVEDLVFTSWQLTMRSAYSKLGSVIVNCGPFALYRAALVRSSEDGYLNETIAGRVVQFSDDALLTLYSATAGRTVQQPSAVAFSAWPETFSHHVRQQVRWCRGSFLRSLWRARYLPINRPAFWLSLAGWAQFLATTAMFVYVFALHPRAVLPNAPSLLVVMCLLSYVTTMRSMILRRSDESLRQQLFVFALSPLVLAWALFVYRPLRIFGAVTFLKTGWGTRSSVESGAVPRSRRTRTLRAALTVCGVAAFVGTMTAASQHGDAAANSGVRDAPSPSRLLGVMSSPWQSDDHERAYGTNIKVVENFMPFGARRSPAKMLAEDARRGLVPLITWMPREDARTANQHAFQPAYSNAAIAAGGQDAYIRSFARQLGHFPGVVVLRYAPEMDGAWEPWSRDPAAYRAAWRHVYGIFQQVGADNVKFAWTPSMQSPALSGTAWNRKIAAYWPGATYVQFVGATTVQKNEQTVAYFGERLASLNRYGKPLILPELYVPLSHRAAFLPTLARLINDRPSIKIVVWTDLSAKQPLRGGDAAAFASILHT